MVDIESNGAALIFEDSDGGDVSTVTMATWRNDVNQSTVAVNESVLTSNVVTVHITGINDSNTVEAEDIEDAVVTVVLELRSTGESDTVRKSASCRYLAEDRGVWLDRGMFLRGLTVDYEAWTSSAMCISTHLTTMGMVDNTQLSQIVQDQVSTVTERIEGVNNIDTFNEDNEPNWFVIGIFAGVAGGFVLIIFIAKATGRKKAVLVGREIFIQQGALSRPSVVGAAGSEAILRGWLSAKEVVLMGFLHIMSGNPFIGLFFHWSHADIVYSRADKATGLFAGLLLTFISTALLVDLRGGGTDTSFETALLEVFVSAVATQVFLLPFKHVLPYMIANVNTVTTNTHLGEGLLKKQMKNLQKVLCCGAARKKLRHKKDVQVTALSRWMDLLAENHVDHENLDRKGRDNGERNESDGFDVSRTQTATSVSTFQTRKQRLHRQMTQRLRKRYLKSQLFVLIWRIKLPDTSGKKRAAMQLRPEQAERMQLNRVDTGVVGQIGRL